jgi:hypothetical protein
MKEKGESGEKGKADHLVIWRYDDLEIERRTKKIRVIREIRGCSVFESLWLCVKKNMGIVSVCKCLDLDFLSLRSSVLICG